MEGADRRDSLVDIEDTHHIQALYPLELSSVHSIAAVALLWPTGPSAE